MAEAGQAPALLQVRPPAAARGPRSAPREEHLIPYVPQIVPSVDLAAGVVYVQPPAGLLELGRQQNLLATLERDLEPFTQPAPLSVLQRMGLRTMPTSAQLEAAGRRDLVAAVRAAGGFLEVAQALGLRSQRKPAGYWEDEMNLDEELTLFVAAHWSKFKDPDSRQSYWYNQITHRISWEEPVLPQRIAIDDEGGYIVTEAEEDRVMPSRSALQAAGRYDLHHAVMLHGGYTVASQSLDRRPAWPPSQHLDSLAALRQELRQFVSQTGLRRGCLPTASQLLEAGRGDLYQAIVRRGGFCAAGQALGWETQRRGRRAWADAAAVAGELRRFILDTQFPPRAGSTPQGRLRRGSPARSQAGERQGQALDAQPLPPGARMPTHLQLASAGRHDLKYALQLHGSASIAAMLGLQGNTQGAHNRSRAREAADPHR